MNTHSKASAAFLPSIKCSNCNAEIQISMMGDHLCGQASPYRFDKFNSKFSAMHAPLSNGADSSKEGRMPPPRIDPSAANRPYLPSHPKSSMATNSRSVTPVAGGNGRKSPFRMPPRSATAPLPYSPPSPDLPLPQDCAFPVFPTAKSRSATPTTPRTPNFSEPRRPSTDRGGHTQAEGHTIMAPMSAQKDVDGFLQRMNTITPGPFNVSGYGQSRHGLGHTRMATNGSSREDWKPSAASDTNTQVQRPATSGSDHVKKASLSNISGGSHSTLMRTKSHGSPLSDETPPSRPLHTGAYGNQPPMPGTKPKNASIESIQREDIPQRYSPNTVGRQPLSAFPTKVQEPQLSNHARQASINRPLHEIGSTSSYRQHRREQSRGASPSRANTGSSTRSTSRSGERTDQRINNAPPIPKPTRAEDFDIGNPYHASTHSNSSNGSSRSDVHSGSSRSSPPLSESSYMSGSKFPEATYIDRSQYDAQSAVVESPIQQEPPRTLRGPTKSFSRPTYARPVLQSPLPEATIKPEIEPPESPMDPAIQSSRIVPFAPTHNQYSPSNLLPDEPPKPSQLQRIPTPSESAEKVCYPVHPSQHLYMTKEVKTPRLPRTEATPVQTPSVQQPPAQKPAIEKPRQEIPLPPLDTKFPIPPPPPLQRPDATTPTRRPTTANKGNCRGCGEVIQGKSVSSADGRLTGRYHKQCFVCHTCQGPFQTADFYVIDNHPYCARHYHVLNGSLCKTCDRGIEGQYLETEVKQKFHPHCFTCQDCHRILKDDYFELNGKVLCEQHAFRATQESSLLGPGRRFPERRTTRLMMM